MAKRLLRDYKSKLQGELAGKLAGWTITGILTFGSWLWTKLGDFEDVLPYVVGLVVFTCAVAVWKLLCDSPVNQESNTISFDKPLIAPGWTLKVDDPRNHPVFENASLRGTAFLKITNARESKSYHLQRELGAILPPERISVVTFVVRNFNAAGKFYIALRLADRDDRQLNVHYWVIEFLNSRNAKDDRNREWVIDPKPCIDEDEWSTYRVDVQTWMSNTWGKELRLLGIESFRLRGEMEIASISWSRVGN